MYVFVKARYASTSLMMTSVVSNNQATTSPNGITSLVAMKIREPAEKSQSLSPFHGTLRNNRAWRCGKSALYTRPIKPWTASSWSPTLKAFEEVDCPIRTCFCARLDAKIMADQGLLIDYATSRGRRKMGKFTYFSIMSG